MDRIMPEETLAAEFAELVHSSMSPFRQKAWKKKWISLSGTELLCMNQEPDVDNIIKDDYNIQRAVITGQTVIKEDDMDNTLGGFGLCICFNDEACPDWHIKAETKEEKVNWLVKLSQVHAITSWMKAYEKVKVLGTGAQGIVYELRHYQSGKSFALKEMEIKNERQMSMAISESQFLKTIVETVKHPNILYIEKVFQVGSKFYLVFPLCTGGELYDAVARRGHYCERDTAVIIRDIVSALHALHENNILHLDIKPENILFDKRGVDGKVMLTDFGLSKLLDDGPDTTHLHTVSTMASMASSSTDTCSTHKCPSSTSSKSLTNAAMATHAYSPPVFDAAIFQHNLTKFMEKGELNSDGLRGTFGYMSPEIILMQIYSRAADVFATGVVLYILLCGYPPFASKSLRQTLLRTVQGSYKIEGGEWDKVSEEAKDLVRRMLDVDPTKRITIAEILQHPWILAVQASDPVPTAPFSGSLSAAEPSPPKAPKAVTLSHENLTGALSRLAEHVKALKTTKMAATITKFLSTNHSAHLLSRLSSKYLVHPDTDASVDHTEDVTQEQMAAGLISEGVRESMANTIFNIFGDSNGRMTIEQYAMMREKLGFSPVSNHGVNIGDMLLLKRIDSDGDGYISAQDMLAAQLAALQQTENLLHAIFRVYLEAVWYPGRQLNVYHAMKEIQPKGASTTLPELPPPDKVQPMVDNNANINPAVQRAAMNEKMNVVVPPKFITEKNVAAIFERMGYDPLNGKKVFEILCETIRRMNTIDEEDEEDEEDTSKVPASPKRTAGKEAAQATTVEKTTRKDRMDVRDFIRACKIDTVLVQVMFKRTNEVMVGMCRRAEDRLRDMLESNPNIKEDLALEAIVEDEVRAQMQRVSQRPKKV